MAGRPSSTASSSSSAPPPPPPNCCRDGAVDGALHGSDGRRCRGASTRIDRSSRVRRSCCCCARLASYSKSFSASRARCSTSNAFKWAECNALSCAIAAESRSNCAFRSLTSSCPLPGTGSSRFVAPPPTRLAVSLVAVAAVSVAVVPLGSEEVWKVMAAIVDDGLVCLIRLVSILNLSSESTRTPSTATISHPACTPRWSDCLPRTSAISRSGLVPPPRVQPNG